MVSNLNKSHKKIGLALGGGGWRGLAHVGVIKVLEKHGIPIDFVAGTSAGALMGGLYCYFGNINTLESYILKFGYKDLLKVVADPKLKNGILKGKKLINYLNKLTDSAKIEDLRIPFSAVSTNLLNGKSYYMDKGNLAEIIKSSVSIPFVFQPTVTDHLFLIDGGATENVPVTCVKEMGAEFVIAVDVNTAYFPVRKEELKSSADILVVTARASSNRISELCSKEADVVIKPKVTRKKVKMGLKYFLEFVKEKDIIKIGEQAAEDLIDEIKSKLND